MTNGMIRWLISKLNTSHITDAIAEGMADCIIVGSESLVECVIDDLN